MHSIIIIMAKRLIPLITQTLQQNFSLLQRGFTMLLFPLTARATHAFNNWKARLLPKPNPYSLFLKLNSGSHHIQPGHINFLAKSLRQNPNQLSMENIRDSLKEPLQKEFIDRSHLRQLRNEVYVQNWSHPSSQALKTLIEIDAKLYLSSKDAKMVKQMREQLQLLLINLKKLRMTYPEDHQSRSFTQNELSCMYEMVNLLKSLKERKEYIIALESLHKMELSQEQSKDKQKHCNRILRKICLYYLMEKDAESIVRHYNRVESEAERKLIRKYMVEFV